MDKHLKNLTDKREQEYTLTLNVASISPTLLFPPGSQPYDQCWQRLTSNTHTSINNCTSNRPFHSMLKLKHIINIHSWDLLVDCLVSYITIGKMQCSIIWFYKPIKTKLLKSHILIFYLFGKTTKCTKYNVITFIPIFLLFMQQKPYPEIL